MGTSIITTAPLSLADYRAEILLDDAPIIVLRSNWHELLSPVIQNLGVALPSGTSTYEALHILHGVLAPIDPGVLSDELMDCIETIAFGANRRRQSVDPYSLPTIATQYKCDYPAADNTTIWVGDITRSGADAIVNAANSALLGCRLPNHTCIDNAIHSAAGPRLRDDCAVIIDRQQAPEPVGKAKITRGYALPARYVLHTVGPQLRRGSQPSTLVREQLARSYVSCLDLAAQVGSIRTIAFCAISTGVFAYPKDQAATVALNSIADWMQTYPNRFDRIVFNLFSAEDAVVYEDLLSAW